MENDGIRRYLWVLPECQTLTKIEVSSSDDWESADEEVLLSLEDLRVLRSEIEERILELEGMDLGAIEAEEWERDNELRLSRLWDEMEWEKLASYPGHPDHQEYLGDRLSRKMCSDLNTMLLSSVPDKSIFSSFPLLVQLGRDKFNKALT